MSCEKIVIFGITGSIGKNSEKIIAAFNDKFELTGCSAGTNIDCLNEIILRHKSLKRVYIKNTLDITKVRDYNGLLFSGEKSQINLLDSRPDKIIMALPGKQGWRITIEAIKRGIPVCLANKESLVVAGYFLGKEITSDRNRIIPIDSEHAALMQLLGNINYNNISKIYITASGGALREMSIEKMLESKAKEALNHPVWNMGKKVTVDSATMLNKGLELIEAYWLFNIEPEQLGVLVHPSVNVHAAVLFKDGTAISQNAVSSMIVPIASALSYPEMLSVTEKFPDMKFVFENCKMEFFPPDLKKYPLLKTAFDLLKNKDYSGMVAYAISDEIAVEKFLEGEIKVKGILDIVLKSVEKFSGITPPASIEEIESFIAGIEEFALMTFKKF